MKVLTAEDIQSLIEQNKILGEQNNGESPQENPTVKRRGRKPSALTTTLVSHFTQQADVPFRIDITGEDNTKVQLLRNAAVSASKQLNCKLTCLTMEYQQDDGTQGKLMVVNKI
jgi:hypothetical protein